MPRAKKVSTQKKENRVIAKKVPTKINAIGEPKYPCSSFRVIASTCFIITPSLNTKTRRHKGI